MTTTKLDNCPRCGQSHEKVKWNPIKHDKHTHAALCPRSLEPIAAVLDSTTQEVQRVQCIGVVPK